MGFSLQFQLRNPMAAILTRGDVGVVGDMCLLTLDEVEVAVVRVLEDLDGEAPAERQFRRTTAN